ncbi:unnamed protein product [Ambrosiozyma monospora]|uniref:Unnamed protein product n=1 Tax=Ambrosiozyma monospora TaxID=43982 RepID=A0ACB5U3M6_AMBMO|nr:unnamed protein product [Ambrosiozyma monospora]
MNPSKSKDSRDSGSAESITSVDSLQNENLKFPREGLRVSLRGYLKGLAAIKPIRDSTEFMKFLSHDPITPTKEEQQDIALRSRLDHLLLVQHYRFQQETIKTIAQMEEMSQDLKDEIYGSGFGYIFHQLGEHEKVDTLPENMKSLISLIAIEIASTQYELFIGTDTSYENLKLFGRLHALFPYAIVGTILRVTNPLQIVKKMIDLFTYQLPVGFNGKKAKSLLQVVFLNVLNEDLKKLEKEAVLLKANVVKKGARYSAVIDKIDEYFDSPDPTVLQIKKNCHYYNIDICMSLLLNNNSLKTKLDDDILTDLLQGYKTDSDTNTETLYHLANLYFKTQLRKLDKVR